MLPPEENDDLVDQDPTAGDDLEPNEDIIERLDSDKEPLLLWVQTCPGESCPCRSALVVAANTREKLDAHVETVRKLWNETEDAEAFAAQVPAELVAFELDIDSGEVTMPMSDDANVSPAVKHVARQIDGDFLDRLASLWYLGKELPDAATEAIPPSEIQDYTPGQLLAWDEVHVGARADVYSVDGLALEAIETYCVRPKCQCNDVHIQFYELPVSASNELDGETADAGDDDSDSETDDSEIDDDSEHDLEGHIYVGSVSVVVEDPVKIKFVPGEGQAKALERLFEAYKARYPSWAPRLAARATAMAAFGERLHAHLEQQRRKPWVSPSRKRRGNKR